MQSKLIVNKSSTVFTLGLAKSCNLKKNVYETRHLQPHFASFVK